MRRKFISLILATFAALSMISSTVHAEETTTDVQHIIRVTNATTGEFLTYLDTLPKESSSYDYNTVETNWELLRDITTASIALGESPYPTGVKSLDLGGRTLTITGETGVATGLGLSGCDIKNGTINCDFNSTLTDTQACIMVMCKNPDGATSPISTMENITIKSNDDNKFSVYALASNVTIKNCVFETKGSILPYEAQITIESGSYKNLPDSVTLADGSKQTTVYGVDATVITSPSTKAIVVKDGMAYTYDTVEAAKAAHPSEKLLVKDASGNFAEEAKKDVTWQTDTDSGVYQGSGMVRFLFNVDIDASSITESGIKCVKSGDITDASSTPLIGDHGTAKAFYADITDIAKDSTDTFYAMAYVKVGETIYWSNVVDAAVNTDNEFTSID